MPAGQSSRAPKRSRDGRPPIADRPGLPGVPARRSRAAGPIWPKASAACWHSGKGDGPGVPKRPGSVKRVPRQRREGTAQHGGECGNHSCGAVIDSPKHQGSLDTSRIVRALHHLGESGDGSLRRRAHQTQDLGSLGPRLPIVPENAHRPSDRLFTAEIEPNQGVQGADSERMVAILEDLPQHRKHPLCEWSRQRAGA